MEGVTVWYVILAVAFLLIALLLRFSTYTFLVRHSRVLPEKAGGTANLVFMATIVIAAGVLLAKALLFSH